MKHRLFIIMTLTLSIPLMAGCFSDTPITRVDTTTAQATQGSTSATSETTTAGSNEPVSKPFTTPATTPDTIPVTIPDTIPVTIPETKPGTQTETKPAPAGDYAGLSNERESWSYGYPDPMVKDYSGYWKYGNEDLYLTMDLGYEMGFTHEILDTLKEKGVKVTFFLTTEYIKNEAPLVERMLAEGHQIGNHSTRHINMVNLVGTDGTDLRKNTEDWEKAYKDLTGKTSHLYRAPEGVYSRRGMSFLEDMGYDIIFWGAAYADYDEKNQPSVETAKEKLYKYIDGGDVVLLHPFETNAKLLPEFIDEMRALGYSFRLVP